MKPAQLWKRYQDHLCAVSQVGFSLDISRMNFGDDFFREMAPRIAQAFDAMVQLEEGAIANPDEKRMVGHYWLRSPERVLFPAIRRQIEQTLDRIRAFTKNVHEGHVAPERGGRFTHLLVIGIGGSALGPEFVSHAFGHPESPGKNRMLVGFLDNTDPDGMDEALASMPLPNTLTMVISKSGSTKETRNGQLETRAAYEKAGLKFARHAVAITGEGSELSETATREGWLDQFPMWDWVGGRTSELSAVGLLPAALQGVSIDDLLEGARLMDVATRSKNVRKNPAALLALMWFYATDGRGTKDMVILPYKDRLLLFGRYLQQLVMESLGKERDMKGNAVHQGITVYGNKGSTDQHAYIQQLRDGVPNFFVTFIEVLRDRDGPSFFVEPGLTSGDYLCGFLYGTRRALYEKWRESITLTLPDVSPRSVGALIALYERAVGLYASLIGINAYHQPGVEAGKKAADALLALQKKVVAEMERRKGEPLTAEHLAQSLGAPDQAEEIYHLLRHLAANPDRGIRMKGTHPPDVMFRIVG